MFWNKISPVYDLFENVYNRKVYKGTGIKVAEFIDKNDSVLECACGTGAITEEIAKKCRQVLATDFAEGMLKRASKKCRKYGNVSFRQEDITDSYKKFFEDKGFKDVEFYVVDGRMPCAVAVITKK
ncbi:MAG: class I SAM-dependent methyltransferase [Saccharofermentans sp.]|nr:class I SAM-dependent methyltransferase [Saccharofermentans sp.]